MPIQDKSLRRRYAKLRKHCELIDWDHDCCHGAFQIHHIMRGIWRHDTVWNMISVCGVAHDRIHDINRMTWEESQIVCWCRKMQLGEFDVAEIENSFRTSVRNYIEEELRLRTIGLKYRSMAAELLLACMSREGGA